MVEKRIKLNGFQAKPSEHERISDVAKFLGKNRSDFLRDIVLKEVTKQEKKMKG